MTTAAWGRPDIRRMAPPIGGEIRAASPVQHLEIAWMEPVDAAERLAVRPGLAFLDSALAHRELGRFSYVAVDPFARFTARDGIARLDGTALPGEPLAALKEVMARFAVAREPAAAGRSFGGAPWATIASGFTPWAERLPPFRGGAVGYVGYDFGASLERLPPPAGRRRDCDDLSLGLYDAVVAFDHVDRRAFVVSTGLPETEPAARARRAGERLDAVAALLAGPAPRPVPANPPVTGWTSNFTREGYCSAVEKVRAYIRAGDIYQANIAQRFEAPLPAGFSPWAFYRRLRAANPATFAAYLDLDGMTVASSSPERFLKLSGDRVEARPIKGTIHRSADPLEDRRLAAELLASAKDRAENVMIVDLLRNDLSRVCRPHSVEVPVLCGLETYAAVHHLVSVVRGRLREGLGPTDLIAASFPGGSITGAPKLRAMEIIAELEGDGRDVYCGSIGYLGFDGAMDLNIVIRTVVLDGKTAVLQAGGGITLLSEPESEYEETMTKAVRVFDAFAAEPAEAR